MLQLLQTPEVQQVLRAEQTIQVLRAFRSEALRLPRDQRHCGLRGAFRSWDVTGTAGSLGTSGPGMLEVLRVHRDPRGQKHYSARPVLSGQRPLSHRGCKQLADSPGIWGAGALPGLPEQPCPCRGDKTVS